MRIIYLQNTTAVPLRFCTYIIHINEHNNNNAPAVVNTYLYTYEYTHTRIYTIFFIYHYIVNDAAAATGRTLIEKSIIIL